MHVIRRHQILAHSISTDSFLLCLHSWPPALPGSRCVKVPMTKSRVEMASTASSISWSRTIHFTPARLIPSSASSTAADMLRTAHWLCIPSTSATDSENPVMYMAPATHCEVRDGMRAETTQESVKRSRFSPHLSEHIQEAHGAPDPAPQDGGDHGVDSSTPNATVLTHSDPRHHCHQGDQHDQGDQQHPEQHACVPLGSVGDKMTSVGHMSAHFFSSFLFSVLSRCLYQQCNPHLKEKLKQT